MANEVTLATVACTTKLQMMIGERMFKQMGWILEPKWVADRKNDTGEHQYAKGPGLRNTSREYKYLHPVSME